MITGSPYDNGRHMEIVDMDNSSFACSKTYHFPTRLYGATGGQIGDTFFICGGYTGSYSNACYELQENGEWKYDSTASLNERRRYAAAGSVIMNNSLVIAGGYSGSRLSSIELVSPNTTSRTLEKRLPSSMYASCIVPWDTHTFMIIGGYSSSGARSSTYFFNIANNTRINGPSLQKSRYYPACHEMVIGGESYIIVVGGHGSSPEYSTEVLSKSAFKNGWKYGKNSKNGDLGLK